MKILREVKQLVQEDVRRYNSRKTSSFIAIMQALYAHPSFLGVLWYRISHVLWARRANPLVYTLLILTRALYPLGPYASWERPIV